MELVARLIQFIKVAVLGLVLECNKILDWLYRSGMLQFNIVILAIYQVFTVYMLEFTCKVNIYTKAI